MTLAQLVIIPGILLTLFLAAALFVLGRWAASGIRRNRVAEARDRIPRQLLAEQSALIADIIAELETNQLSSLSAELRDRLFTTYSTSRKELPR